MAGSFGAVPGDLDDTFGTGGKPVLTEIGETDFVRAMVLQTDGKIVAAGYSLEGGEDYSGKNEFALVRYTPTGIVDRGFGTYGKVVTPVGAGYSEIWGVAMQKDGKILAVGYATDMFAMREVALVRYLANGSLDTSFGTGGKVITDGAGSGDIGAAVAVQADGSIVVGGFAVNSSGGDAGFVLRYKANGSLDAGFGTNGKTVLKLGSGSRVYRIGIQSDGKIVAAGNRDANGSVTRLMPNGTLDTTFGTGGTVVTTLPGTSKTVLGLAVQATGKIVAGVAPLGIVTSSADFVVLRYNADGTLDNGFGTSGQVTTDFGGTGDVISSLVAQPDGKILVAGTASISTDDNMVMARYTSAGALDVGFGSGGKVVVPAIGHFDTCAGAAVQGNGKIVMAGCYDNLSDYDFAVLGFAANGSPDSEFGKGIAETPLGLGIYGSSDAVGHEVGLQSDGKILVGGAGFTNSSSDRHFAVARYTAAGVLDTSFGTNGIALFAGGAGWCMAIQSDDKIVMGGGYFRTTYTHDFCLVRFNADGSVDTGFGDNGRVTANLDRGGWEAQAHDVAIQPDGKIVAAGHAPAGNGINRITVVRFHANGTLDTGFGIGGVAVASFHPSGPDTSSDDYGEGIALMPNGKILVTGSTSHYTSPTGTDLALVCFNSDGSLDGNFASGGMISTPVGGPGIDDFGGDVKVQRDGKILVAGLTVANPDEAMVLLRYLPDGSLDSSFGAGGKVLAGLPEKEAGYGGMTLQKDGRILLAGYFKEYGETFSALLRYLPDGSPDESFGSGGMEFTDIRTDTDDRAQDVMLQPDGKILVAGYTTPGEAFSETSFMVARYYNTPMVPEIGVQAGVTVMKDGGNYAFGSLGTDAVKVLSLMISNTGTDDLTGVSAVIEGQNAGMFSIVSTPLPALLEAGGTAALTVRYQPSALGAHKAVLRILSNDADEGSFEINLTGTGIKPQALKPTTVAATGVTHDSALLKGAVNPLGKTVAMAFEYGLAESYGSMLDANPAEVSGTAVSQVSAALSGLMPHTKYYYRVRAQDGGPPAFGAKMSFTTANRKPVVAANTFVLLPGATVVLNVGGNDSDPDGDAVSVASNTAVTPAGAGKLALSGGVLTFVASASFDGGSFTYKGKDAFGGTSEASATVTLTKGTSSIDPVVANVAAAGVTYEVDVQGVGAWSVNEAVAWISGAPSSVIGHRVAEITLQPNTGKAARTATILIAGKSHTVTQAGVLAPSFEHPDTVPGGACGGTL